jgi:hypothetical protein
MEEFQRRVREFWPRFLKTIILGGIPGVALAMIGGEKLWGSPLTIIGLIVFLVAFARAIYVWQRYLRCPACDTLQFELGGLQFPYHVCAECGARLSRGARWME